jgi:hypothetical protein
LETTPIIVLIHGLKAWSLEKGDTYMNNVELGKKMVVSVWVDKERHEQAIVEKGGSRERGLKKRGMNKRLLRKEGQERGLRKRGESTSQKRQ